MKPRIAILLCFSVFLPTAIGQSEKPAAPSPLVARVGDTCWAGINAEVTATFGKNSQIEKVEISYPGDPVRQYLRYGAMYDQSLLPAESLH